MSEEYQRLQDAARDVEREIVDLEQNHSVNSAAELAALERRLDLLAVKRSSLTKAMILLRSVNNPQFQQKQKEFVRQLPHKYHSQGPRRKVVHLPGGVNLTLNINYYHRQKGQAKASQKPDRGLYPALMLLSISNGLTPHVRRRMAKASALLGSYEEAAEMLSDDGIIVSVNKLREVCGRIGRKLVQMTSSGSMQVEGNVKERRIVVSRDGGRVRLREPRKGRTKKGRKKFAANWREPRLFIIYAVDENGRMTIQKRRLLNGEIGSVVIALETLLKGRKSKNQTTWLNYFRTHGLIHRRMDYSSSRSQQMPIGSGAIESAVRRVINLRVKSNSTYWLREHAETMIRLRAWIKAGRAEELFRQTTYTTSDLVA